MWGVERRWSAAGAFVTAGVGLWIGSYADEEGTNVNGTADNCKACPGGKQASAIVKVGAAKVTRNSAALPCDRMPSLRATTCGR